jgi:hypothetical protein
MRWTKHVACTGRRRTDTGFGWGIQKERDPWKELGIGRRIIRWVLEE